MPITICIPAYKRVNYLKRLLDSVAIQTFKDFEVVVTDDSPDDSVSLLCRQYENAFAIHYFKNPTVLGTPANWNFAISKAGGEWIKLMHDDDWFAHRNSLQAFANATKENRKFIFSGYTSIDDNGKKSIKSLSVFWKKKLYNDVAVLLAENIIGPPSVTLLHSSIKDIFDEKLKWRVDVEFYYRVLRIQNEFIYINKPLVNVGINNSQVTQSCINKPEVELPEGYIVLQKHGIQILNNIIVYDAWWRLLRNMSITTQEQLKRYVNMQWPNAINYIVKDQKRISKSLLSFGVSSKFFMLFSYIKNRRLLKDDRANLPY